MFSFSLGVASLALLLGTLVGASSSPVAGVAVTAGFGVVIAVLGYMRSSVGAKVESQEASESTQGAQTRALSNESLNLIGRLLILFSFLFASGVALGIWARTSWSIRQEPAKFPWEAASAPTSAQRAIDWILVHRNLRQLGFNDAQVSELYRLSYQSAKTRVGGVADAEQLLSPLFSQQKVEPPLLPLIAHQPPPSTSSAIRPLPPSTSPTSPRGKIG
jgi:hypothetical protein